MPLIPAALIATQVASQAAGTASDIAKPFAEAEGIFTEDDERRRRNIQKMLNADAILSEGQKAKYFEGIPEAEREAYRRSMSDTGAYDFGGGFFASERLARGEAQREQTALKQAEIREREEAERERLRGEKKELAALEREEQAAKKAARWEAVGTVAEAAPGLLETLGRNKMMLQEMQQMDEAAGLSPAESSIAGDVAAEYTG